MRKDGEKLESVVFHSYCNTKIQTLSEDERKKIEERDRERNLLARFLNETEREYYKLHPKEDKAQS